MVRAVCFWVAGMECRRHGRNSIGLTIVLLLPIGHGLHAAWDDVLSRRLQKYGLWTTHRLLPKLMYTLGPMLCWTKVCNVGPHRATCCSMSRVALDLSARQTHFALSSLCAHQGAFSST